MTNPVDPPLVINLPPAPLVTDSPEVFDDKSFPFAEALDPWGQSLNALAQSTKTNAVAAKEGAVDAQQAATEAASSAAAVSGAANFKGLWSDLSGPLNMPATVKHNGRFWLLTRNVTAVQSEEPGVSTAWTSSSAEASVIEVSTNTVMQPGVIYGVTTANITLSLPATVEQGDVFSVDGGRAGARYLFDWGAFTAKGEAFTEPMPVPAWRGLRVVYTGTTFIEG